MTRLTRYTPLALALAGTILLSFPAFARDEARCPGRCAPQLRECLQDGRPALRACLRDCRAASDCPIGVDPEDCIDATELHECVDACRDARRIDIRACVGGSTACAARCAPPLPGPTPTATPLD
jgi:hypothetical protein